MEPFVNLFRQFIDLFKWFAIVSPWEQGIRVRLGKTIKRLDPGTHFRVPIIDEVFIQSVRLRVTNCPTQTVQTADKKLLSVGATIAYAIADIEKLYQTLHHAEDTIINMVMVAIASEATAHHSDELTPELLALGASKAIQFGRYGLKSSAEIRITDYAMAKTYRLIMDQRDLGYGAALDTESRQRQSLGE